MRRGRPFKDRLVSAAAQAGLRNTRFFPFQSASVLDMVQATADFELVTLSPEAGKSSVPSKVLGCLAAGRPVVASVGAESDTTEMIRTAECGLVTRCPDPGDLAHAITTLADGARARERYDRCGRAYFERVFDQSACVNAYERVLLGERVVGESSPRGL